MPMRKIGHRLLQQEIESGFSGRMRIRTQLTGLLYAPIYYRLQMGASPLSDADIDEIFDRAMKGLWKP
jgi:hypothetical protein